MLSNLIYFRRLLISQRTGHLTKKEVLDRVKDCTDISKFVEAFEVNDPLIFPTIEYHIDCKCDHLWIEDDIDIGLDGTQRIKYCQRCELNFYEIGTKRLMK